jgi:hypothetical protein
MQICIKEQEPHGYVAKKINSKLYQQYCKLQLRNRLTHETIWYFFLNSKKIKENNIGTLVNTTITNCYFLNKSMEFFFSKIDLVLQFQICKINAFTHLSFEVYFRCNGCMS